MEKPQYPWNPVANTNSPTTSAAITIESSTSETRDNPAESQTTRGSPLYESWSRFRSTRAQQLINFSFTPTVHLLCITTVLSISKFCNAAALNASQVTASAPSPSLIIANLGATLAPQLDKLKSLAPASANSISPSGGNSIGSTLFTGKSFLDKMDFAFLNVSGKRNTSWDICKYAGISGIYYVEL